MCLVWISSTRSSNDKVITHHLSNLAPQMADTSGARVTRNGWWWPSLDSSKIITVLHPQFFLKHTLLLCHKPLTTDLTSGFITRIIFWSSQPRMETFTWVASQVDKEIFLKWMELLVEGFIYLFNFSPCKWLLWRCSYI